MIDVLTKSLLSMGLETGIAGIVSIILAVFCIGLLALLAHLLVCRVIIRLIEKALLKTASTRDDILVERKTFARLPQFVPAFVIYSLTPVALGAYPAVEQAIITLSLIYMLVIGVLFFDALISAGVEIYASYPVSKEFPIKSFAQVAKLLLYFVGFITLISLILGESPLTLFAGLGALTAVLMLVFKDPILGFVAGVQLSANKMVSVGDWIEMPKFGVDGDVMEIALTTVKIRNFDKTITTVPTQALIADSFKNWRGMQETGGRRIKRSLYIDLSTIRFCDEEMLQRFSKIQFISKYLQEKEIEVSDYNRNAKVDMSTHVNGRRLTNVGTFRAYIEAYLKNHPQISKSLTLLVRQLQPTENGLPIEVYAFSLETNWLVYESIQADIFDHILAAAKEFDLRVFQKPSGQDLTALMNPAD